MSAFANYRDNTGEQGNRTSERDLSVRHVRRPRQVFSGRVLADFLISVDRRPGPRGFGVIARQGIRVLA